MVVAVYHMDSFRRFKPGFGSVVLLERMKLSHIQVSICFGCFRSLFENRPEIFNVLKHEAEGDQIERFTQKIPVAIEVSLMENYPV